MLISILSHFDHRYGPKVFYSVPELPSYLNLEHIPSLMDLHKEGFFIHEFGNIKTANLIFEIYSRFARGKREMLMLSVVTLDGEYNLNLSSFREIMEFFVKEFKNINELYVGLRHEDIHDAEGKYHEIMQFMHSFSNSLPDERAIYKQVLSKILTYGLSPVGTNTIIKSLQEKISHFKAIGEIRESKIL